MTMGTILYKHRKTSLEVRTGRSAWEWGLNMTRAGISFLPRLDAPTPATALFHLLPPHSDPSPAPHPCTGPTYSSGSLITAASSGKA